MRSPRRCGSRRLPVDTVQIAAHAGAHTKRVGFLVAHRPGFQSPTTAARAFTTLDQLTGGRAAIHVISGGGDADQARNGDWLGKEGRAARSAAGSGGRGDPVVQVEPAIHDHGGAGHVAGEALGQERHRHHRDVFGSAEAAERDAARKLRLA